MGRAERSVVFGCGRVYIVASYQNVPPHVMKSGQLMFDDLIPAYEHCWDYRTSDGRLVDRRDFSDQALVQVAECERTADRWQVVRTGALFSFVCSTGYPRCWLGLCLGVQGFPSRSPALAPTLLPT